MTGFPASLPIRRWGGTHSLTVGGLGGIDDTKEEDPDQNATVIALLKGMLSLQVQISEQAQRVDKREYPMK